MYIQVNKPVDASKKDLHKPLFFYTVLVLGAPGKS